MTTFETPFSAAQYDAYLQERDMLSTVAIQMQVGLSVTLVQDAQRGNKPERKWLALSSREQRELMERALEGSMKPALEEARTKFVPEIRMARLLERGGRGFIDLMKRCAVPGGNAQSLSYLENARFDEVAGTLAGAKSKTQRLWIELILARRHVVLYAFVTTTWTTLQGAALGGSKEESINYVRDQMASIGGHIPSDHSKWLFCAGCTEPKGLRPERKFKAECQRAHWKGGHKKECGLQPLSHHAPTFEVPTSDSAVSRPTPTVSLQAHINLIKDHPHLLYTVFLNHGVEKNLYSILPRDDDDPHEACEQVKYFKLRQRAFDTMEGDAVLEFYLALRRRALPHDQVAVGGQPFALTLKLQVAREFDLNLDPMLEKYLDRIDGPPPKLGTLTFEHNPRPCSEALQRQIDANRDGDYPEAGYYFFGPDTPPGGLPMYTSPEFRKEFDIFRRWTIRSRHPALVGKLYLGLARELEYLDPPGFTLFFLMRQILLEFELSQVELERGIKQVISEQLKTNPESKMNIKAKAFEELMQKLEL
ncbi:hypothetical protein RQP46_008638 [Phenoliferia psychrophenolica]